jgi:hypothetical protein
MLEIIKYSPGFFVTERWNSSPGISYDIIWVVNPSALCAYTLHGFALIEKVQNIGFCILYL